MSRRRINRSLRAKEQRQEDAIERQEVYDQLSPKEQLKVIARRPGNSSRERARLEAMLAPPPPEEPTSE